MVKISKESQLIEEISGLIDNSNISTQELEILSNAKNKLEHFNYITSLLIYLYVEHDCLLIQNSL